MYSVRLTEYLMNFIRCTISKSVFVFVRDSRNNSTRVEFMAVTDLFAPPPALLKEVQSAVLPGVLTSCFLDLKKVAS